MESIDIPPELMRRDWEVIHNESSYVHGFHATITASPDKGDALVEPAARPRLA